MFESQGPEGLIGRTFKGYRVTRFVARGGMGMVYAGVQESLDRPVAIKFLYPHLSDDDRFRERFEREARFASRMVHPNIVRVLDFGTEGMLHFMILDLIEGDSLRDRLGKIFNEGLSLRTETILHILEQVGSALSYAHQLGYVHRDVKPGNILVTSDGQAYLTDFGVVKMMGTGQVTSTGMIIGTPEYMSPEQSAGVADVTPAADQYSLAVVAYEMLVGRVPFQAPTPAAVMRMQLSEPPPPPSAVAPWFPAPVEAVLMRALAKDPLERYESVDAFIAALSAAVLRAREAAGGTLTREAIGHSATVLDAPSGSGAPAVGGAVVATGAGGGARRYALAGGAAVLVLLLALGGYFAFGGRGARGDAGGGSTPTPAHAAVVASSTPMATATAMTGMAMDSTPSATQAAGMTMAATPAASTTTASTSASSNSQLAILFSAGHRNNVSDYEIFIMNVDGSGQRQFTQSRGHSWGPRISPDGSQFFFSSVAPGMDMMAMTPETGTSGSGNHDVYIAGISGSSIANLQPTNIANITAGYTSWDNGWTWSPDGKWVAFTSDRDGHWQIYKMTTDGKTIVQLTNTTNQSGWPWWTADGKRILFSSDRTGSWEIYVMDTDGSNVHQLTNAPGKASLPGRVNLYPAVSPDGTKIVFSSQLAATNEGEIYVMNMDGTGLKRLTDTAALNNIPSYCPDGRIVFTSDRDARKGPDGTPYNAIYIMNGDGTNQTPLTSVGDDITPSCGYVRTSSP